MAQLSVVCCILVAAGGYAALLWRVQFYSQCAADWHTLAYDSVKTHQDYIALTRAALAERDAEIARLQERLDSFASSAPEMQPLGTDPGNSR